MCILNWSTFHLRVQPCTISCLDTYLKNKACQKNKHLYFYITVYKKGLQININILCLKLSYSFYLQHSENKGWRYFKCHNRIIIVRRFFEIVSIFNWHKKEFWYNYVQKMCIRSLQLFALKSIWFSCLNYPVKDWWNEIKYS